MGTRYALACSFEDAALNHLRDNLAMSADQRWSWLRESLQMAGVQARRRAQQGGSTTDANGEVWWSPLHERLWCQENRLPPPDELVFFTPVQPPNRIPGAD